MALTLYHDSYQTTDSQTALGHIVLLHGWGMHSLVWDELIPALNKRYVVTVIDLPGLGRSPMPAGDYNLDYLLEHVLAVAPEKAIWIGWSLGGLIVQKIAAQHSARLESAFVLSGTPKFVSEDGWPSAMPAPIFEKFFQMLAEDWQGTLIRFLTLQCKNSDSIKSDTKILREIVFHYGLPAIKALREGLKILQQEDLREDLKHIKVPIHFILGENDNLIPKALETDLKALNEKVFVRLIDGASHVPQLSHAKVTAAYILSALLK